MEEKHAPSERTANDLWVKKRRYWAAKQRSWGNMLGELHREPDKPEQDVYTAALQHIDKDKYWDSLNDTDFDAAAEVLWKQAIERLEETHGDWKNIYMGLQ